MTGASPGDAEDLLGQFLAHRAAPTSARSAAAPPAKQPDEAAADEALEESVDSPVYELTDEPLDFSEPAPPVADTMAHAGAVLEAFASGTLDIAPDAVSDAAPDAALDDEVHAVDRGVAERADVPERTSEPPAAAPAEAAAFEQLAVSSPLTREPSASPQHLGPATPEVDDRPDATAASAAVFAAFQAQLARQEEPPTVQPHVERSPEPSPEPSPRLSPEPGPRLSPEPSPEPSAEPSREASQEASPEPSPAPEQPIAPPTTRAEAPKPARHRPPKAEPKVTAPRLPAAAEPEPAPAPPAVPNEVVFKPRRMARALVALILLVFVAASAVACWWAYRDRTLVPVGIAATVLIATGIVWATRAGSTVAHLSVKGGRLEITKDGTRTVFDLSSAYTDVQVHGTPGKRNWRVMFGRRGLPPYVVDASMVSPAEFMRVLDYYRPSGKPPVEH